MFSSGACKKESCRINCLVEVRSSISHAGQIFKLRCLQEGVMQGELFSRVAFKEGPCRGICLAEMLSRISHAGRMCLAELV